MEEIKMKNKSEKIVICAFILMTIFLLSISFVNALANYTIDTLNYDNTTSDLISTNFYNIYNSFIFDVNNYRSQSTILGDSISAGLWDLERINLYDKEIVGVNFNMSYDYLSSSNYAKICVGNGSISIAGYELQYDNGYCLSMGGGGLNIYPTINLIEQSSIYTTSQLTTNTLYNIQFYIDNGQIIFVVDDVVYANITDTSYIPDINTSYMFTTRHYDSVYTAYINVSSIKDMVKHDCFPNWIINNSACYGNKYYKGYYDLNDCGKPLPIDNGTFIDYCDLDNYYINECQLFNISNSVAHINITSFSSPCMIFNVENSSINCVRELNDTYSNIFAYIQHINDVDIHDCSINNFIQDFLIPEVYLEGSNNNNNFYNLDFDGMDSSAFGFDVRQGYGQSLNHTSIQNINIKNTYSNGAINMYGDGINDMLLDNINIQGAYSGIVLYLISNLYINHYYMNSGTIYGLFLSVCDNAIVENSQLLNVAFNTLLLQSSHNVFFSNVENEIARTDVDLHFVSGDSNFTSDSNYNTGWFPTQNILYNDDVNLLSRYLGESKGENVIGGNLVFNKSIKYFIAPECIPEWTKFPMPCIDGVAIINYKDYNDCNKDYLIPLNNGTNEYCSLSSTVVNTPSEGIIIIVTLSILIIAFIIIGIIIPMSFGLTIAGIISMIFSFVGKKYFPTDIQTIMFWILIGIGISLITIGVLYVLARNAEG
jgi:hypothetical protein